MCIRDSDGSLTRNRLFWFIDEIPVNESVTLTFDATVVHFIDRECDYRNVAQIVESFTFDPDSTPDNDDGDQSEDDEDFEEVQLVFDAQCVTINTGVFLEGAYDVGTGLMSTELNRLGYLPGQTPSTFFGVATAAGQPYNQSPWFYNGAEGAGFSQQGPVTNTNGNYPLTATDWVLVSLRTEASDAATTVCERAALLHNDGSIQFIDGFECCNLDITLDYYVVIEHRNHLIVMSDLPLPVINGEITYDFRNRNSYQGPLAIGVGQKEIEFGVFVMFAGNGDQQTAIEDAIDINSNDLRAWLIDDGLNSSYFLTDFDLNGDVNVQDKGLFLENNGVFSEVDRE